MAKLTFGAHPFLLGFDQLDRMLERTEKNTGDGYPPYNVEQLSEDSIRITIAVAGFSEQDISVTVEDQQLIIAGQQPQEDKTRVYLHRGIAARQFQRRFVLAEGMDVLGATLKQGLLEVDLQRRVEEPRITKIDIGRR